MTLLPEPGTLWLPFREAASSNPLRVGIVVPGHPIPWTDSLVAFLQKIPNLEVETIPLEASTQPKSPPPLLNRLYTASRARFDPFGAPTLDPPDPTSTRPTTADVLIWLAGQRPTEPPLTLAKHGVFTVRLGDQNRIIPFWDEIANSSPTSLTTILWHDTSFDHGRVPRTAETSTTHGLFVTQNSAQPLVAAIRLLAQLCLDLQRDAAQFREQARRLPEQPTPPRSGFPSNFQAARFAIKKLARSAWLRVTNRGRPGWFVALRPNAGKSFSDLQGFREIPLPPGTEEMADPFLWQSGGKDYLLFEEVPVGQSRARLACVEIHPDATCSPMTVILDRSYHLSYPCIIPSAGDLFLMPESYDVRRIDLYRFTRFPDQLELVASPVENAPLVDTTPIFVDGLWYIFTTTAEPFMETVLFTANRLDGPWRLHPSSPISTSVKSCRSAGHLFQWNGRLFRPTQDCSLRYGYAITVNEVTRLTPCEFEERAVASILPDWMPGLLGTHTWNESAAFQVIDGIRFTP